MDKKIKLVAGEGAGECFGPVRLLGGDGTETMKMAMLARGGERGEVGIAELMMMDGGKLDAHLHTRRRRLLARQVQR